MFRYCFAATMALCLLTALPARAATLLDFDFQFFNGQSGDDLVTGVVRGLMDNTPDQPATSLEILTHAAGFGVGEYVGSPSVNSWTVENGEVTTAYFLYYSRFQTEGARATLSLFYNSGGASAGLTQNASTASTTLVAGPEGFFQPANTAAPAPVPLPAGLSMLIGALGVAVVVARPRRIKPFSWRGCGVAAPTPGAEG